MTRLFLDTNIVVDLLERREPFCHDAVRLKLMLLLPAMAKTSLPLNYL